MAKTRIIQGLVDLYKNAPPINYASLLYSGVVFEGRPPELWGDILRDRFTKPYIDPEETKPTITSLVIRPNWNDRPNDYYAIPPQLQRYLVIGDRVEAEIDVGNNNDRKCLGNVRSIRLINNTQPRWISATRRINWLGFEKTQRIKLGDTPFEGPLAEFLKLTHSCFGGGERGVLIAPAEGGKSSALISLFQGVRPGVKVVCILSERPEENLDFRDKAPCSSDDVEYFIVYEDEAELRRLHNAELGFQRAMRLAEQGHQVVILFDSITKGVAMAVNKLPTPEGVGIESGGINPLTAPFITVFLRCGGRYQDSGEITIVATVLNEANNISVETVNQVRRDGTAFISLSAQLLRQLPKPTKPLTADEKPTPLMPPIDFSLIQRRGSGGETTYSRLSNARRSGDWMSRELEALSLLLQNRVSVQFCYQELLTEADRLRQRPNLELLQQQAIDLAVRKLQKLWGMILAGESYANIFHAFDINIEPLLAAEAAAREAESLTRTEDTTPETAETISNRAENKDLLTGTLDNPPPVAVQAISADELVAVLVSTKKNRKSMHDEQLALPA